MMLDDFQSLKHLCIGSYEMAHCYKSIHNLNAYGYSSLTSQYGRKHCNTLLCKYIWVGAGML